MTRIFAIAAGLILLAGAGAFYWYFGPKPELTVTTWEGAYGRAQQTAQMAPYQASHRVNLRIAVWDGDLKNLKGDVVDFELPKAAEACQRGLLEKIDAAQLPAGDDGTPAEKDFLPGAIGPCWVGNNVYSQVIVSSKFPGAQPTTLADFFDTEKFPGRRALKRGSAKYNMEMALLAVGVAPKDIYPTLSGTVGILRALGKLSGLGDNLTWYHSDAEGLALIQSGGACFTTALNGAVFESLSHDGNQNVIWDHQLYEFDAFGIPAGNARKDLAMDFIRFATGAKPLAGVAQWQPFGPARRSGLALVGENPATHKAMRDFLPTAHFDTAFAVDETWWRDHGANAQAAWAQWQAAH